MEGIQRVIEEFKRLSNLEDDHNLVEPCVDDTIFPTRLKLPIADMFDFHISPYWKSLEESLQFGLDDEMELYQLLDNYIGDATGQTVFGMEDMTESTLQHVCLRDVA